jgi:''Cold-shock'' DNA-binding domain.
MQGKVKWFNNAKGFGFINTQAKEGIDEHGNPIDFLRIFQQSRWTVTRRSKQASL